MIWLALELSSVQGSLALLRAGQPLAAVVWRDAAPRRRGAPAKLEALLREAGVAPADLGGFAVGRGPGNYSGLRIALTLAQTMALPSGLPVIAVSSGAALARAEFRATRAERVTVYGDARRGQIWHATFARGTESAAAAGAAWALASAEDFAHGPPPAARAVSSDAARLAVGYAARRPDVEWEGADRFPLAADVGALAWERRQRGEPSDPLTPLYLHAAVAGFSA